MLSALISARAEWAATRHECARAWPAPLLLLLILQPDFVTWHPVTRQCRAGPHAGVTPRRRDSLVNADPRDRQGRTV